MTRPVVLGRRGLRSRKDNPHARVVRILEGREAVSYISGDDYHRYDRQQRAELGITPLDPAASHLDISASTSAISASASRSSSRCMTIAAAPETTEVVQPVPLRRRRGAAQTFTRPSSPAPMTSACSSRRPRKLEDVEADARLHPPRVHDPRGAERARSPRARRRGLHPAASTPTSSCVQAHEQAIPSVDAHVILRDTLKHPDLSPFLRPDGDGPTLVRHEGESLLGIPGDTDPSLAAELEEAVWSGCSTRVTSGRSDSASSRSGPTCTARSRSRWSRRCCCTTSFRRATISAGIDPHDRHVPGVTGADSVLHA